MLGSTADFFGEIARARTEDDTTAARPWTANESRHATTWYEPYTDEESVARGVRFALSVPGVHAFCTPGDVKVLSTALDAAAGFTPMTEDDRRSASDEVSNEPLIFPMPQG